MKSSAVKNGFGFKKQKDAQKRSKSRNTNMPLRKIRKDRTHVHIQELINPKKVRRTSEKVITTHICKHSTISLAYHKYMCIYE